MLNKKILLVGIITIFLLSGTFAILIPFVSKKTENRDNVGNANVSINGVNYNLDVNNTDCKSINISNGRINCIMDINGEEVVTDAIILDNEIDITGKTNFNSNIALHTSLNGESYTTNIDNVLFSIYSDYSYKIDGHSVSELSTKTDFENESKKILDKLKILNQNYVQIKELPQFSLDQNNKYCDINTTANCNETFVQFLEKDPLTKKVNLDLLINYSE